MSKNLKPNLKAALKDLVHKSEVSFTADTVIKEFSKPKDKNTGKKLWQVLKNLTKNNREAIRAFDEITNNFNKLEPYDCLILFLQTYEQLNRIAGAEVLVPKTQANQMASTVVASRKSTNEVIQVPEKSVMEVKNRVVAAATSGLSKSARTSSISNSIVNNSLPHMSNSLDKQFSTITSIAPRKNVYDFINMDIVSQVQNNVVALPLNCQEQIIISELLHCLSGMKSSYILADAMQPIKSTNLLNFTVSEQINSALRHIVEQILPLAGHYALVNRFITYHHNLVKGGQVLQAFGAALRNMSNEYLMALVQLESEHLRGSLSLQKLLYFLSPIMHLMSVLAETITDIEKYDLRGAKVLTLLYDKISTHSGDEQSQQILISLTEKTAIPYIDILELWILKGVIIDPHEEFMIADSEIIRREEIEVNQYSASYWEKRYKIRRDHIPRFLDYVADIILRTGKYLNVIRQCGNQVCEMPISVSEVKKLSFTAINDEHIIYINNAYRFASRTLLQLLVKDKDLMGHLTSVKRYLLMNQGDFICEFMDASEEELSKNINEVLPMKLENLVGLALRMSSAKHDPYKEDLHCDLYTVSITTEMSHIHLAGSSRHDAHNNTWSSTGSDAVIDLTGFECFAFRYDVEWPVSLVLNHFALSEYKMIFRLLFYCKHVERQLCKAWINNKNIIKFESKVADDYRFTFSLRQKMMYTIQSLEYYIMIEVIEPMWHDFLEKMSRVENVDDVLNAHQDFIDICLLNCMLKSPELLEVIFSMSKVCLAFCKLIEIESKLLQPSDKYLEKVKSVDEEFSMLLMEFLNKLNVLSLENPSGKFINLVHRINFNSFYTEHLSGQHKE